jgi:hypothetical protein
MIHHPESNREKMPQVVGETGAAFVVCCLRFMKMARQFFDAVSIQTKEA